jgi:HEAT repeat protein
VAALTAALSDPDPVVRGLCAMELSKVGPAALPALSALTARLQDADPIVRMEAAVAIGAIGPKAAPGVPALVAACRAPGQTLEVVRESATALGNIGPAAAAALPALKEIAAHPIPHVGGVIDLTPAWAAERAIRKIAPR